MAATIGCGLQDVHAFPLKKTRVSPKNTTEKPCNVSHHSRPPLIFAYLAVKVGGNALKMKENVGEYGRGAHPITTG